MADKAKDFIKTEILKTERNSYFISILIFSVGYAGITLWLNAIRASAPIMLVWVLIIIQLLLYFSIFTASYLRAKVCGFKRFGLILFLILAFLGRVNDWELLIIPILVITMMIISARNNNVSNEIQHIIKD